MRYFVNKYYILFAILAFFIYLCILIANSFDT